MIDITELSKPIEFWDYFQKISAIPRCSNDEEKIRRYIKEQAEEFDFRTEIDDVGNLIVKLFTESNKENKKVILQSHFDMVCEKNSSSNHDFRKDPLKLEIIEKEGSKWVTADGTSLGADNGVGLAYSLALMKLIHEGKLKFSEIDIKLLFTVNEEGGLVGAFQIEKEILDADFLINLDCMDAQTIIIGCVGGMYSNIQFKLKRTDISDRKEELVPVEVSVKGLLGGHSGLDIDKGRANAIKVLVKVLLEINKKFPIYLEDLEGGENFNAIPREAKSLIYVNKEDYPNLNPVITKIEHFLNTYYARAEDNIRLVFEKALENEAGFNCIKDEEQEKILNFLYVIPHGPILKHSRIDNLIHTSTNFASVSATKRKLKMGMLHRSFDLDFNEETSQKVRALLRLSELNYKMKDVGGYGVWEPNSDEELLITAKRVFETVHGGKPEITAMHAGLECGAFKTKRPDMQMITIGPTIEACHSPDEALHVKSVEKFWKYLVRLLSQL